jgi:hypothetical protein
LIELLIYLVLFTLIFIFDVVPLLKAKAKKPLLIYIPVFLMTFAVCILSGLDVRIPSPAIPIKNAVTWIFGAG